MSIIEYEYMLLDLLFIIEIIILLVVVIEINYVNLNSNKVVDFVFVMVGDMLMYMIILN